MSVETTKPSKTVVRAEKKTSSPAQVKVQQTLTRPSSAYFTGRALKNQELEFAFTDLNSKAVLRGIEDFEKLLVDLKRVADEKGAKVGLMFIPSKVQLIYEISKDRDIYEKLPVLKDMAINHIKIEKQLAAHMSKNGFYWSTAAPEIIAEIEKSDQDGSWVYPSTGGHPYPSGYRAYAKSAKKLYERMGGK